MRIIFHLIRKFVNKNIFYFILNLILMIIYFKLTLAIYYNFIISI